MGHWGMRLKILMYHGGKIFFLRWVVVGFERCLPTPLYIYMYFWNSPNERYPLDKGVDM
jgi:hypothetical protein